MGHSADPRQGETFESLLLGEKLRGGFLLEAEGRGPRISPFSQITGRMLAQFRPPGLDVTLSAESADWNTR